MRKTTKRWLIAAAILVDIGLTAFGVVMSECQWDFEKLNTGEYETNTYEIEGEFSSLSMNTDTADIVFALTGDGSCRVECFEEAKSKHSVTVEEDTLSIKVIDERAWYDHIGICFGSPRITVYLPESDYSELVIQESTGDIRIPDDFQFGEVDLSLSTGNVDFSASASGTVKIRTSTGKITVENISAGALDLSVSTGGVAVSDVICGGDVNVGVSTGKAVLSDIECRNLTSNGSTGDISLENVIAAEKFSITRSTGDIRFDGADAAEIFVETDTGDVTGTLLSEKTFIAETGTGRIDVPKNTTGGKCEIRTDTGDVRLDVR